MLSPNIYQHDNIDIPFDTFLNVFGSLDVQLLVTDLDTDEILYANEKMNRSYGVNYDPVGKCCWEVYQKNQTCRCNFWPLDHLQTAPDKPIVWEIFNTATGRWFRNTSNIIEWSEGWRVHLQQGVDITEMKRDSETLARRLEQQQFMGTISQSFISTEQTPVLIQNALKLVGDFLLVNSVIRAHS